MPEQTGTEQQQTTEKHKSKKQEIIERFPKSLIEELSAHLQATQIEEDNYRVSHGEKAKSFTEEKEKAQLAGRIFEILVEMEFSPNQPEIAKTLLSLMQNPDRCRELNLFRGRNLDLTFTEIDSVTGIPVVKAIGDAKLGLWDDRMRKQLVYAPKTLNRVLEAIRQTSDTVLEKINLSIFTGNNKKIRVGKPLEVIIFVPSDVDQNKLEDNIKADSDSEKIGFAKEMKQKGIKVVKSSFSRKDVSKLRELFYAEIQAARNKTDKI